MRQLISLVIFLAIASGLSGQSPDLAAFVESYVKNHNFSGTILIKEIRYHKSFNSANIQFSVPNTNETRYKIASVTKIFTSVLIMQLYDQGKICLDSSIKTYIPDYHGKGADLITIR